MNSKHEGIINFIRQSKNDERRNIPKNYINLFYAKKYISKIKKSISKIKKSIIKYKRYIYTYNI